MQLSELNQTDRELVRGCLENNRLVQRALYERFSTCLYTLAYRLISDREASNDVLQDAFIEIFRSLAGFRFESSLYTWMRTILIRNAMSYLKRNARLQVITDEIPDKASEISFNFTAEHLEKAILSLPAQARSVFILIEIEGYKHQEVAEILNINEGTSKSQLNYAKKLLRRRVTKEADE
ncbi:MAG: RNA polymerase sigma factor [Bacteroidales bacterium]|nr:RNA polymerase sigma factor [Bacteroidales bacterium]MDT8374408.1 RNA polymerase sigma factor [Bacteroidales bacterium]